MKALAAVALIAAAPSSGAGYLDHSATPDLMRILPPPPRAKEPRDKDDRATFRQTRSLKGSDRWLLATRDVTDDRFTIFACAMGMTLDVRSAPTLAMLFAAMSDGGMVSRAKAGFAVPRPYLSQPGEICEPKTPHLATNGDYPSGHTVTGWSTALVLAELMPDRATQILRRGRVYGESRFICGSHSRSAVEAGYLAGASLVAAWHSEPAFRTIMESTRQELANIAHNAPPPDPKRCELEAKAD